VRRRHDWSVLGDSLAASLLALAEKGRGL